jgi:uncharacterized protein YbaR (Trm112 family)
LGQTTSTTDQILTQFPRIFLPLLHCNDDAAPLHVESEIRAGDVGLIDATLVCTECGRNYHIVDGIVRLLGDEQTPEDAHEIAIRNDVDYRELNATFAPSATDWRSVVNDSLEIPPFLAALAPLDGRLAVEIGSGDGRLTLLMAQMGAHVLAVDFSINALAKLAGYLPTGIAPTSYKQPPNPVVDLRPRVGLINANASQLHLAPGRFDRALSTTPLDSRAQRLALYATLATALNDEGRFIGSVEYDNVYHRSLGLPVARRYDDGGIFIEYFDIKAVRRETGPFFKSVRPHIIRQNLPFARWMSPALMTGIAWLVERLPGLRQFGTILIFRAEGPFRAPAEGVRRRGWPLLRAIYRRRARGFSWELHQD